MTLSILRDRDYLALARTSAMHVGALLDLSLAWIADLRLAVNEACACFLSPAARGGQEVLGESPSPGWIQLSYDLYFVELRVTVRAAVGEIWPAMDEPGWIMLRALVGDVRVEVRDGLGILTLVQPIPTGED